MRHYQYTTEMDDELRPAYDLRDLLKDGIRGKYVARYRAGTNLVLLDPDVDIHSSQLRSARSLQVAAGRSTIDGPK